MKTHSLIVLCVLMSVSLAAPAKGVRIKSSGHSSGSKAHADSSGGGVHLPAVRARSNSESNQAQAAGATAPAEGQRADVNSKIDAELAAQRTAARASSGNEPVLLPTLPDPPAVTAEQKAPVVRSAPATTARYTPPTKEADLSGLNIRESNIDRAARMAAERDPQATYNSRGVNCSVYPARCR